MRLKSSLPDEDLLRLRLDDPKVHYQVLQSQVDSSDTPWDNPFDDNPDNDDDTCANPEGCDGGGPEAAKETCSVDLMSDSKTEVYMLAYGFIQGFYHSENYPVKTGCTRCAEFALPLANA